MQPVKLLGDIMGILGEGRSAITEAEEARAQATGEGRDDAIKVALANLDPILQEPEFTGDVETALVHYMGGRAFTDEHATEPFTDLAERIEDEGAKDKRRGIPVLFVYRDMAFDGPLAPKTAYLKFSRGPVEFKSATTVEEDVTMHAFTGEKVHNDETGESEWQPTTANVTHKRLSAVAHTVEYYGDVLSAGENLHTKIGYGMEFAFSESHTADGGRGRGMPSAYAFRNSSDERLSPDYPDNEPKLLVGWEEIETALLERLRSQSGDIQNASNAVKEAFIVRDFFGKIGELPIKDRAPELASIIEAATDLQKAIGGMAGSAATA